MCEVFLANDYGLVTVSPSHYWECMTLIVHIAMLLHEYVLHCMLLPVPLVTVCLFKDTNLHCIELVLCLEMTSKGARLRFQ